MNAFTALSLTDQAGTLGKLRLSPAVEAAVWRGTDFGHKQVSVRGSGWAELDAELPGGGWPCGDVTEVLTAQPSILEWRLIGPALRLIVADGGQVIVVGPPRQPHLPGLLHEGLDERRLIWIQADLPAERLWVTEQLIKSNAAGAMVAWLPQARQEQLRRLQVCAQSCEGLVFLCRPEAARRESSAAPLRLKASVGIDWELRLEIFKRRGPVHAGELVLPSIPGGLQSVITPRLRKPSRLIAREVPDVVGSPVASAAPRQDAALH
ncbi:MAG: translesion DNA synthesis-associated protein ImuA [Alcaligenaceae bacterium]|nr:MAG: translesion DNA synthesis-associated protein ImuA [Alcaligenaceae bacterium]